MDRALRNAGFVRRAKEPSGSVHPPESYKSLLPDGPLRGRGAGINPANRFDKLSLEVLGEHLDCLARETHAFEDGRQAVTEVYRDKSQSILNEVRSPDLGFHWTINPYRGCEHGCIYCYARPGHEYLSLSCGADFETKIFAKPDAPELLRKALNKPSWKGEPIVMSGVTDCYQPIESQLGITRQCLEVMLEYRQAVSLVTKSRLILRDLDILGELAKRRLVRVAVSVTSLDNELSQQMEPRAASPRDRLWTIRRLASAGVPVMAMVAPVIPGINDRMVPAILKAVAEAGALTAAATLLRLPYQIKDLFEEWLERHFPDRKRHVLALMMETHNGKLYEADWHERFSGSGPYAEQLQNTFRIFKQKYGLDKPMPPQDTTAFRRPADANQMSLFER